MTTLSSREEPAAGLWRTLAHDWLNLQLLACLVFLAAVGVFGSTLTSAYYLQILILASIFAIMGIGWAVAGGHAGQLLIGYITFFGIGAYVNAILFTKYGISPWLNLFAAAGISGLAGALIAAVSLRFGLNEDYFGLFTVAVSQVAMVLFLNWHYAGRATGIYIMVLSDDFLAMSFIDRHPYLYIALGLVAVVSVLVYLLLKSRLGYFIAAVRENTTAAAALGINVYVIRLSAIAISAAIAGVAGAFYSQFTTFIDPQLVFGLALNFEFLLAPVVGGRLSLFGPVLGAAMLRPLKDLLRGWLGGGHGTDAFYLIIFGLVLIVSVLSMPNGIAGMIEERHRRWVRRGRDT